MADIIINNSTEDDGAVIFNASASQSIIEQARVDTLSYKNQALVSANNASTSETNAGVSETNAASSALSASNSATEASGYVASTSTNASNASTYATNASNSATQASGYADSASASATLASGYATSASGYKDTALAQTTIATTKASEASASASEALASRNEAQVDRIAVGEMLNEFKTIYWGSRTSDPDSLEVTDGDLYYNSNTDTLMLRVAGLWGVAVPSVSNIYTKPEMDVLLSEKQDAADFTNANIKIMYEANLDTNAFTDDEKTKLGLIEDGATADMSALEIKTSYESNTNTNAFTDAYKAQLDDSYTSTELDAGQLDNRYYTETEVLDIVGNLSPLYNAYGYTKALAVEQRFLETDTPNVLTDNSDDKARFSDGIYDISDRDITLPVAPFAPTSTDELLDDKVNGLTCQMAHSKGDVVVTGNELVTNGTFDTDTSGWSEYNITISVDAGRLKTVSTGSYGWAEQIFNTEIGKKYIVEYGVDASSTSPILYIVNTNNTEILRNTTNSIRNSVEFTSTTATTKIRVGNYISTSGQTNIFDNISVKLKDNIYQATLDTADMYDYAVTVGSSSPLTNGLVYRIDDAGFTGNNLGDFVRYDGATVLSSWTNGSGSLDYGTADWTFVGTASTMSLQNPYFQTLPQVTRQDVITLRKHKTTKAVDYHTFKGLNYFGEGYSQADVMSHYGYSQVDKNLWEDATYEYVFVGLESRLNAGAYHPVYNAFGTARYSKTNPDNGTDAKVWYETLTGYTNDSVYIAFTALPSYTNGSGWTFLGDISGVGTARPDSKFYDKVYLNGYGGLIPSSKYLAYAGKEMPRLLDSESNDLLSESWLEEGVEIVECLMAYAITTNYVPIEKGSIGARNEPRDFTASNIKVGGSVYVSNGEIGRIEAVDEKETYYKIYLDRAISSTTSDTILIPFTKPHLLTYKSSTTTDIIGNPSNYPTDWLSHLASGKSIVGNALLVNQKGDECIPDGTTSDEFIASRKIITQYNRTRTLDFGSSWTNDAWNFDLITNSVTSTYSNVNYVVLKPYTSANQSALQSDPQKVLQVQPKVIASNSHSVYKGAMMTYAGTGKVAVGNGSNGLESRVLENVDTSYDYELVNGTTVEIRPYFTFKVGQDDGVFKKGDLIKRDLTLSAWVVNYPLTAGWYKVSIGSTPTHSTISLDNSNSPATKWFTTLAEMEDGELAVQTFSEEMIWDYDADVDNIVVLDGTSSYKPTTAGVIYRVVGGNLAGHIVVTNGATFDMTVLSIENGQVYYNNTIETRMSVWDGNGFGDNNKFNQLTNGTSTDLNNNTIQTKVLTKRLGIYKGDI